jgi:spermidine synthase
MAAVTEALVQPLRHAVYLGGGGFTLPTYFEATQGAKATVLELDEALVELAQAELGLSPGPWLDVRAGDARLTLHGLPDDSADAVLGDAYGSLAVPWHLATVEFTREIRRVLSPGGAYVVNVVDYPPARFVRAEAATIAEVFEHVALVAPPALFDGSGGGNYVVVASEAPIDGQAIADRLRDGEMVAGDRRVRAFVGGAAPLTDAFAPVDQLLGRR